MTTSRGWALTVAAAAALVFASKSWAVDSGSCTPTSDYNAWISTALVTGAASAPAADTAFIPVGRPALCNGATAACGRVYFAKGTTLYSFEDRGTSGSLVWSWALPTAAMGENSGSTINNFPSATPGDAGHPIVVYLGGSDGRLYKLDGQNNCTPPCTNNLAPLLTADLRRKDANGALLCNIAPGDAINATPAVLLNSFSPSGGAFQTFAAAQGHAGADLVFAATFNGCGDSTHNAIYALWSDNFAVQWVFQGSESGPKIDAFTEGCYLRYEKGPRNTCGGNYNCTDPNDPVLFCGTLQKSSVTAQDSVFNINVITTDSTKRLIWSHNAGSLSARPMLNDNATLGQRLYVTNQSGTMYAYGPDGNGSGGPDIRWSYAVAPGSTINRSPWIEPRGGTFKDKILVLDTAGVLRAFQDNGSSTGPALWTSRSTGTATWVSLPIVLPGTTQSFAYVGRSDGFLQQVDLAGGYQGGRQQVNTASTAVGDVVFDPSLDLQDSLGFNVNRAYVVDDLSPTNHAIKRFKLPFCNDSGGSGTGPACTTNPDGTNTCPSWAPTTGQNGSGYNPCVAIPCDSLTGSCEWARATGPNTDAQLVAAPDGIACDDGRACTQAPIAPSPISCTTNDDCPHADVTLAGCACAGGNANACATFTQGTACTVDDGTQCTDPNFPRCNTNISVQRCEALCPGTTTLTVAATLPTSTLTVATTLAKFPPSGTIQVTTNAGVQTVTYTGVTATSFTGCSGGTGTAALGSLVAPAVSTTVTAGGTLPMTTISVGDTTGYATSGAIYVTSSQGPQTVWCTGKTATSFTGCAGGSGTVSVGAAVTVGNNLCANCSPRVVRTYFMKCVASQCVCNSGSGVNCNDVCLGGTCTGSNTSSCACLQPGDRACATGSTCCGQNNGGCLDVTTNPQHCGACSTDCGTYRVPVSTSVGAASNGQTLPFATINVASTAPFASSGTLLVSTNAGVQTVTYTNITPTSFTGCSGGTGMLGTGGIVVPSTATACTSNNDCMSCSNDGQCVSAGLNSKCEDIISGTGHCGKCSVDCSCFFDSDCASKGYFGATCTGAVFPSTLGTCTGGTPACAGYCKRLVATGHCTNGVCDNCSSGACACDFPSVSDFTASPRTGMSGLAFERVVGSSPQVCGGYISTYNDNITGQGAACGSCPDSRTTCVAGTCQAISLERIAKGGAITNYTSSDFHPLHGVAVPMSGWDVLGNFVANTGNPPAGLAERGNGVTTFTDVLNSTSLPATGANNPFNQAKLNDGMVGPALDFSIFADTSASTHQTYFGNFNKTGDVVRVTNNGVMWIAANFSAYIPSQVSCGGGCGASVLCTSPGHVNSCSTNANCGPGGSTCVAGSCRCTAPETCDGSTGNCACVAPASCSAGTCACPGAATGETCSAGVCTCTIDSNCGVGGSCVNGHCAQRVTAMAIGQFQDSTKGTQRRLVVGHGSTLSIIDLGTGAQTDVNLATAYVPAGGTNQATVNGILSIAMHPQYGDLLVEVKGTNNFRYLLNVDAGDNSVRHELTVQQELQHTQTPTTPVPPDFGNTADGHLVFMPDGMLLRFAVVVNAAPAFATYKVSK